MNILIKNASIITGDSQDASFKNCDIGIKNGYIEFIGTAGADETNFKADRIIEGNNKLVMPGLVNAHTHSAMTILRNFADDMALEDWLFNRIIPAEAKLSPEDVYWGAMLGITEMIKSGTTCFADMYLHMEEVAQAVLESGIRANISKGPLISGVRGHEGTVVDVEGCTKYYKEWHGKGNGRIKVFVEIHSVYLFDEEPLKGAAALAKELGTGIHIHVLETAYERETILKKYGISSVELCAKLGILDVPVIAAHCVHLSDSDIDLLRDRRVSVVHNPTSNLKLGSGIARIPAMLEKGINVCLGTDGAASNNNLNMFEEMHLAALIHKGVNLNPLLVSAQQSLNMASVNGAKALAFEDVGTVRKGMKADLIILDCNKPHLCPVNNAASAAVYSAQAADVETVIINGNIVMEKREIKTIDEEKVKFKVREIADRIL